MPEIFEDEIHLRDYLRVILKRRWMVAAVFIILVTFVTIHSFMMEPIYRATTQILIEKENPKVVNIEEVMGVNASDQDYYQTQYEILKSKALALKVIKSLNLKESPEFCSSKTGFSLWGALSSILGWIKSITFSAEEAGKAVPNPDKEYNRLIAAYLGRLKVEPIRNSRLVNVSFEGRNPKEVTRIVNTHAKLYIESNLERKFSASQDAVHWLNQRIKEEKKNLERAEFALQEFREKEDLASIDFDERQGIIIQSLDDLNAALTQAKTERIEKENLFSELKRLSQKREMIESIPAVVSNPLIQELKSQYVTLTGEYHRLSQKYGPEHPKMIRLSSEIRGIKNKISQEIKNIARSIETEYRIALAKEKSILKAMEDKKKEALMLNKKQIKYNALKREVDISRSLYESLLKRLKEASLTEGLDVTNIMVVDPARVPDHPVKPKKLMNILLAIIVGLTLGIGLAFFFEYLDNTIKIPEEVERYLKLPLLGVVGTIKSDSGNPAKKEIITYTDPRSNIAESFRTIRTNLSFSSPDVDQKRFLITSALPLEGKTIVAANLAITFAQMGKNVLLVDSDLRKPRIHNLFGLNRGAGLSDFLVGKESSIKKTKVSGLNVFTCGTIPPNPAELLGSKKMRDFVEKIRENFEVVIFDSPPLLSVTDAAEIAPFLDGVVLVIKAGSTTRPAIQRSIQQLSELNVPIVGCILNDVDFEKEHYYYSPYQYYYQYYYEGEEGKSS